MSRPPGALGLPGVKLVIATVGLGFALIALALYSLSFKNATTAYEERLSGCFRGVRQYTITQHALKRQLDTPTLYGAISPENRLVLRSDYDDARMLARTQCERVNVKPSFLPVNL